MTKIARGEQQCQTWCELLLGYPVHAPSYNLRGRASRYAARYDSAFHAMLARARRSGYDVVRTLGPRGGAYSATYSLTAIPTED